MFSLKTLPLRYQGELHSVRLVNFSVDLEEVRPVVPAPLQVRELEMLPGRALISMVDVQLRRMRLAGLPPALGFSYRHIGFRLLVSDKDYPTNHGLDRGIFFLRSFTGTPWVAHAGSVLTHYRLQPARLNAKPNSLYFTAKIGDGVPNSHFLGYALDFAAQPEPSPLLPVVAAIDRAYAVDGSRVFRTQIMRESWPLAQVAIAKFETDWFKSARPEAAFAVTETIPYKWLPPLPIQIPR